MDNNLREQIYESMNLKDTDELLGIWQSNNRAEWSDVAFDVVREVLTKRIGELPIQDEPVLKEEKEEEPTVDELGLEEWEAKLIDSKDQPDFYDTWDAIDLIRKIHKAAKWVLIINVVLGILTFPTTQQIMFGLFPENPNILSIVLSFLAVSFSAALGILLTYFPLKALAHILRILMQMEFNSRK
jgi:hypothetical protein